MTGDRVEVLRRVLDQVERDARNANDGEVEWIGDDAADHGCTASGRFIESWTPSRVLRLVERDRKLLKMWDDINEVMAEVVNRGEAYERLQDRRSGFADAVDLAAVFWLGEEPG